MKNLKKILLFTLFTIFIQSCNNDDDVKNEEPTQKAVEEKVLDFKINNPQTSERLMNNIQVGEVLEFELSIPDGVYDPKASYKLSPLSVEAEANKKHQRIGVDYVFNKPEYFKTSPSGVDSVNELGIFNQTQKFSVKVLKPGNFQLEFKLIKIVDDQPVGKIATQNLLFSAVKIIAEAPYTQTRDSGVFNSSEWRREYYFRIDCGSEEFDNYLLPSLSKKNIQYTIDYEGAFSGQLNTVNNANNTLRESVNTEKAPTRLTPKINSIKVTVEYTNGEKNVVEYKGISVSEYRF